MSPSYPRPSRSVTLACLLAAVVAGAGPAAANPVEIAVEQRTRSLAARDALVEALMALRLFQIDRGLRPKTPSQVGFRPVELGPYTLFFAPKGKVHVRRAPHDPIPAQALVLGPDAWKLPGVKGFPDYAKAGCPITPVAGLAEAPAISPDRHGPVVLAAAANLDDDPELDCWSIATVARAGVDGEEIPAGVPFHEASDWDETLLVGVPETEQLLQDQLEVIAAAFGRAWHLYDVIPVSLEEIATLLPDVALPGADPWGTPYRLQELGAEMVAVSSAGADKRFGTGDDILQGAPRRAGDDEAKAQARVIDELAARGITSREEIDKAIAADRVKREEETAKRRREVLERRGFSESPTP